MSRTRLLIARVTGVVVLLLAFVLLRYSPGPAAKPLVVLMLGGLVFAIACGVFGSQRKRIFWLGFAVFMAVYAVMGVVELFRVFGHQG